MSCKALAATAIAAALLCGCATQQGDLALSPDPNFGEAHRYNAAIQTINPAPVYAEGSAQPGEHGAKGAEAVKRYRTDQVKQVETMETTGGTTGSGSARPPQ